MGGGGSKLEDHDISEIITVEDVKNGEGLLYLSSRPVTTTSLRVIERNKITAILDVTNNQNITHIAVQHPSNRITYKNIPMNDVGYFPIHEKFDECFEFINEGRKNGSVLVHCEAGVSRSASITIAYLYSIQYKNLSMFEIYQEVKQKRNKIRPNFGFIIQLTNFAIKFQSSLPSSSNLNDEKENEHNGDNEDENDTNIQIMNGISHDITTKEDGYKKNEFLICCVREYYAIPLEISDQTIYDSLMKHQMDVYEVLKELLY